MITGTLAFLNSMFSFRLGYKIIVIYSILSLLYAGKPAGFCIFRTVPSGRLRLGRPHRMPGRTYSYSVGAVILGSLECW